MTNWHCVELQTSGWNVADTAKWLRYCDLAPLVPRFAANSISGAVLLALTANEFAELVPNKFHRRAGCTHAAALLLVFY